MGKTPRKILFAVGILLILWGLWHNYTHAYNYAYDHDNHANTDEASNAAMQDTLEDDYYDVLQDPQAPVAPNIRMEEDCQ